MVHGPPQFFALLAALVTLTFALPGAVEARTSSSDLAAGTHESEAPTMQQPRGTVVIGDTGPPASGTPTPTIPAGTGTRWIQLLGTALFLGIMGVRHGVLRILGRRGALPELRARIQTGLWRTGWVALALLLIALPLRLRHEVLEAGAGVTAGRVSHLLFQTAWGAGWFLHLAVVALAVIGLALVAARGLGERGWGILAGATVLLPLVPALQGHAWEVPGTRGLAVATVYLHTTAAGLWLGGLLLLLFVGIPAVRATPAASEELGEEPVAPPALARLVNAFSRVALPAVALVLVTGLVNSWLIVGGPWNFFGNSYGRLLLLKLGVVGAAFLLGFHNWRRVRPGLTENPDPGALRIPASVEAALGILVLLFTAVLVAGTPP